VHSLHICPIQNGRLLATEMEGLIIGQAIHSTPIVPSYIRVVLHSWLRVVRKKGFGFSGDHGRWS
jgi:hypothetical protein